MPLPISVPLLLLLARIAAVFFALVSWGPSADAQTPDSDLYVNRIRPLLRQRCTSCHGALRQEAGLRVDTAVAMRSGGTSGPAIVPGDVVGSLLLQ